MTQRRRRNAPHRQRRVARRTVLLGLGAAALAAGGLWLRRRRLPADGPAQEEPSGSAPEPNPALPAGEWRAMWVSYLEWSQMDFSSEEAFRADVAQLMDNCVTLGLNTVLAQVRPFGDALYPSALFPWSHLCTGTQGVAPGLTLWISLF